MSGRFHQIIEGVSVLRNNPRRLAFSFHRISKEKKSASPFARLAAISPTQFDLFSRVLKSIGKFVNLDRLLTADGEQKFQTYIHFSFDDVCRSFYESGLSIVERHRIPVIIYPAVKTTDSGYSWRDKFYYILQNKELLNEYVKKMDSVFGLHEGFTAENVYVWSKGSIFNQKKMEGEVVDEILGKHHEEFLELIHKHRPYLSWDELKSLKEHPLVTIGNHGFSHYNYCSLTDEEIEEDIRNSHAQIEAQLGIRCRHFALPFGEINQKSFLAADRILNDLGYETAAWVKRINNPRLPAGQLKHYFRINVGPNILVNSVKTVKAALKTQYHPLSSLAFSSQAGDTVRIAFEEKVTLGDYKTFFRRLHPSKFHYQNDSYIEHLYEGNPFHADRTLHLALKVNDNVFAIGSLFYIPCLLRGKRETGAYFCGWYRFPEFPSQSLRARKIFEEAISRSPILGAYSPSPSSMHFYEGWDRVKVYRLKARVKKAEKTLEKDGCWDLSDRWDPRLQRIIDQSHQGLLISIRRGEELYRWRIERYPLCRFCYLYPKIEPQWFVVLCRHKNIAVISDFCLSDPKNREQAEEMFRVLLAYGVKNGLKEFTLETSNRLILEAGKKFKFKPIKAFFNVYRYPGARGEDLPWDEMHETQISGDVLPRFFNKESE